MRLSTFNHTFGGNKISQSWHDLFIWELVLNEYPPARILELGTFTGGMATYLNSQAILRGADFYTFDCMEIEEIRKDRSDSVFKSPIELPFRKVDVLSDEGVAEIAELIQLEGRSVVFCDNGDKTQEAHIYTRHLKKDDVLAVHDWGTECDTVPEELTLYEPDPGLYEELKSMTRFFIK